MKRSTKLVLKIILTVVLLALLATASPVIIGGLGLHEGAVIWTLTRFGIHDASAFSAAFVFGGILMIQSLPGLAIWVAGVSRPLKLPDGDHEAA